MRHTSPCQKCALGINHCPERIKKNCYPFLMAQYQFGSFLMWCFQQEELEKSKALGQSTGTGDTGTLGGMKIMTSDLIAMRVAMLLKYAK